MSKENRYEAFGGPVPTYRSETVGDCEHKYPPDLCPICTAVGRRKEHKRIEELESALKTMRDVAAEAAALNDADHIKGNSIRAHKLLMAMAGAIPGYRADIDAAHLVVCRASNPLPPKAE